MLLCELRNNCNYSNETARPLAELCHMWEWQFSTRFFIYRVFFMNLLSQSSWNRPWWLRSLLWCIFLGSSRRFWCRFSNVCKNKNVNKLFYFYIQDGKSWNYGVRYGNKSDFREITSSYRTRIILDGPISAVKTNKRLGVWCFSTWFWREMIRWVR